MHIKTFRAPTMKEAIAAVKAGLGPDAVVLSTKTVKPRSGRLGRISVEVTAALDPSYGTAGNGRSHAPALPGMDTGGEEVMGRIANLSTRIEDMERSRKDARLRARLDRMSAQLDTLAQVMDRVVGADGPSQEAGEYPGLIKVDFLYPKPLKKHYKRLIFAGVNDDGAREIIEEAAFNLRESEYGDARRVLDHVAGAIMDRIHLRDPFQDIGRKQIICALIGPTGVGKTTTIAKLAAVMDFDRGRKAAFLTIDTFRVGAIEQLRTYAKIMGTPLEVVDKSDDLPEKIARHADKDVIFLDTAGVSQKDTRMMRKLTAYFEGNRNIGIHLIVSATTQTRDLFDIAESYQRLPLSTLIASKLDESNAIGGIYNLVTKKNLPLSYFTIGQNVPEDIEMASKERVVDLMLGITSNEKALRG